MIVNVIVDDRDGAIPGLSDKRVVHVVPKKMTIAALPDGMESGMPSVAIVTELPSGEHLLLEFSLWNFQMANAALLGRYGDVT